MYNSLKKGLKLKLQTDFDLHFMGIEDIIPFIDNEKVKVLLQKRLNMMKVTISQITEE